MRCTCGHDRDRHRHHHTRTYCTHGCPCMAWEPGVPWLIVSAVLLLILLILL